MNLFQKCKKKFGKEASSKILDDIGILTTENNLANSEIKKRDDEISKLKTDKEQLQDTNMSLLQQVKMTNDNFGETKPKEKEPEEKKPVSFRDVFDEKGNFKH